MLSKAELHLASILLKKASNEFSNNGCNDFYIDDTPENRAIIKAMYQEPYICDTCEGKKIITDDWWLMSHLAERLKVESKE
jgi:hypothetical protein